MKSARRGTRNMMLYVRGYVDAAGEEMVLVMTNHYHG